MFVHPTYFYHLVEIYLSQGFFFSCILVRFR